MSDDRQVNEVSLKAELADRGVSLAVRSRALSAIDHLIGSAVEALSSPLDEKKRLREARTTSEISILEKATSVYSEQIDGDPGYAAFLLGREVVKLDREHRNKSAVVALAIEDLGAGDGVSADAEVQMDQAFLNRFEAYSAGASSAELRERWGRVLSKEVRSPGTFSPMVLRVIDELDSATATLFERLCANRIGPVVVKCLAAPLEYEESSALMAAGLLHNPEPGQISTVSADFSGFWIIEFSDVAIGFKKTFSAPGFGADDSPAVSDRDDKPAIPVYDLTPAGAAIASILDHDDTGVAKRYIDAFKAKHPSEAVEVFRTNDVGEFHRIEL